MNAEAVEGPIAGVLDRMTALLGPMEASGSPLRHFLATYSRTTRAVGKAVAHGDFEDPDWVERWDAAFAELYVDALEAFLRDPASAPRPWRSAFSASASLPPLRLLLLGVNAHINYDLPQSLLAVISDQEFTDPALMARRQRDHERIDRILGGRVGAEDAELAAAETTSRSLLDRALTPLNRLSSKRFLRESRQKVWHNTTELQRARLAGPDVYRARLAELEVLSSARIADLLAPGQVVLRMAVAGFGVTLPPPA